MPGASVRIGVTVRGVGQGSVGRPSLLRRCGVVDSRSNERMAKHDVILEFDEAVVFYGFRGIFGNMERVCGTPHQLGIARRIGSDDQQQSSGRG